MLMAASIGGMMVVIALRGGIAPLPVIAVMFAITIATAAALVGLMSSAADTVTTMREGS